MNKRQAAYLSIPVIVLIILVIGAKYVSHPPEPVRIGYIGSLSGNYAPLGSSARNGAILAVEEINTTGGIHGAPLQLVIRDDEGTPDKALEAVKEFGRDGIRFVIGPLISASAIKILGEVNREEILTIGPVIAGEGLSGQDDYFIKLFPSTRTFGLELANLVTEKDLRGMTVISDMRNRQYCETLYENFNLGIKKGGSEIVHHVTYRSGSDPEYKNLAVRSVDGSVDGVLMCASALDTAILSQKIQQLDSTVKLFSSSWAISKTLLANGGNAIENLLFFVPYDYGAHSSDYGEFVKRYSNRFGLEPTYASMYNFEAVNLLANALRSGPDVPSSDAKKFIVKKGLHQGLQYEFNIDSNGDAWRPLVLHAVKDGTFRRIK